MDYTYKLFNSLLPYDAEVTKIKTDKGFGKQHIRIFEKSTNKTVIEYERNYGANGDTAWSQFQYNDKWYLIISEKYYDFKIIDVETLDIVAELDKEKTGCNFCPVNFYVLPYWKWSFNKEEYFGTNLDDENIASEFNKFDVKDLTSEQLAQVKISYTNKLLIAGVWWAADYDWELYCLDLDEIFKEKIIFIKNKLSSEIYRDNKPIIQNFVRIDDLDITKDGNIKYLSCAFEGVNRLKL